ncbi:conserved hypothetical protein [Burkholderia vietnamiensis]|nr:conserved hypothetical protein [Burkholderia vietnamiensis]
MRRAQRRARAPRSGRLAAALARGRQRLAEFHEFGDRQHRQPVLLREALDVVAARHRAVRVHQLAQHAGRLQAREDRQVDRPFGVTAAREHAARLRTQREHMAGAHDVVRLRVVGDRRADRRHAVGRGHAGMHAFARLDRHGERGAVAALVGLHHRRQLERADLLVGQAQAHDAAALADQQRHRLGRDALGGDDQIGLVLTIVIVLQHDRAARAQRVERGGDARRHRFGFEQREIGKGVGGCRRNGLEGHVKRSSLLRFGRKTFQGIANRQNDNPLRTHGEAALTDMTICTSSLIRTMTVGSGIRPDLLTPRKCAGARGLAGFRQPTAGGEFRPALKTH